MNKVLTIILTIWSMLTFAFTLYTTVMLFIPKTKYTIAVTNRTYMMAHGQESFHNHSRVKLWLDINAFEDHFNVVISSSEYYHINPLYISPNDSWYNSLVPYRTSSIRPDLITFTNTTAKVSTSENTVITWCSLIFDMIMTGIIIPVLDGIGAGLKEKASGSFCDQQIAKARISALLMLWPLLWTLWSLPTNSFLLDCPESVCVVNPTGLSGSFIFTMSTVLWICFGIILCTSCVRIIKSNACSQCHGGAIMWVLIGWFIGSLIGMYWKIKDAVYSAELAYNLGLYAIARFVNDWFADTRLVWGLFMKC